MFIEISDEGEMRKFGARLGALLVGGECIELVGDVGAGKTTLVKGIAAGLAISEDVQSPSFTISRMYPARESLQLAHYDFYRLQDPGILRAELAETVATNGMITIIEWADVIRDVLPTSRLTITFSAPDEFSRTLALKASGALHTKIMSELS